MSAPLSSRYRTAFVTGASTGLGRAFAEMLLDEGVAVWGTSRDVARLAHFSSRKTAARFTPVALELRDAAPAEAAFRAAEHAAGGFDVVVNNAGFGQFAEFTAADFSLWREQIEVMLVQPARLAHLALPGMRARKRGALVNISSLAAEFPLPFQSAYNLTKSGLSALSESLMIELAGTGVVVIDFRPGDYRTDFEGSVRRPAGDATLRMTRAWQAFAAMMRTGPEPAHAAAALRRALRRGRSGTVRTGRFFQAVLGPFLARFGSQNLNRRVQARYFDV
ncbi:MAG TPA: SDR family NAD(P)-dependent oxidoreductase [Opitutaceae bacterium]|nr:SDR family NAD(P)-dependent oxidoreductase [Opitutaceae bacterium]